MKSKFIPILIGLLIALVFVSGCYHVAEPTPTAPPAEAEPTEEPTAEVGIEIEPTGETAEVTIKGFAFNPATLTIKAGTTVTWTNEDSAAHTATGDDFDSGNLKKGKSFSHTFNEAGTFDYICTIHPYMKATIIVE